MTKGRNFKLITTRFLVSERGIWQRVRYVQRSQRASSPERSGGGKRKESSTNQHFASTFSMQMLKFQRRSCKLSFLFPPRCQSAPESSLAGYEQGALSGYSTTANVRHWRWRRTESEAASSRWRLQLNLIGNFKARLELLWCWPFFNFECTL